MQTITVERRAIDYGAFRNRRAAETDCARTVTEPCKVFDQAGNLVVVYDMLDFDPCALTDSLKRIKYAESTRTGGLVTRSRTFGHMPRLERRQRAFCNKTTLMREHPDENREVCNVAGMIHDRYCAEATEVYLRHRAVVTDKVKAEWMINGTVFTSGIINKNNALAYHYDSGNFEDVLSCMLVLRKNITGGYLCFPEIDTKFLFQNRGIAMFDGQKILHGVTPMHETAPDAYRYSIVYYSLKGMWKCLTMTEELAHARAQEMEKLKA